MEIKTKHAYHEAKAEFQSLWNKSMFESTDDENERLYELGEAMENCNVAFLRPEKPAFKAILLQVMKELRLNEKWLAAELRITEAHLSAFMSGDKNPDVDVLKIMHNLFYIDGNLLLESF